MAVPQEVKLVRHAGDLDDDGHDIVGGSGAPDDATYLVATAHAGLSAEVAVGATPGGELGGTWAAPTVDGTHSGSSHAGLSGQPGSTDVAVADGGTGASTASGARTNLGVVIGTDVAAFAASASQAEMEAGTEAALRAVSPLRVAQAIAALSSGNSLAIDPEIPAGTINGVNDTFTLSAVPDGLVLFKNGLLQRAGAGNDYTLSGGTITYLAGNIPQTGDTHVAYLTAAVTVAGRVHHVYPMGYTPSGVVTGGNLGINGGTLAQQIVVPGTLYLDTLRYRNFDTATARSIEFGLFRDDGSANAVCVAVGTDSFTPGAASNRTPAWTSAPVTIAPGVYWFVVRNTGGATNFLFSFLLAGATTIGLVQIQSKTLAGALPAVASTLDMTTGWTRTSVNSMAFALIGRVFGESSAW